MGLWCEEGYAKPLVLGGVVPAVLEGLNVEADSGRNLVHILLQEPLHHCRLASIVEASATRN